MSYTIDVHQGTLKIIPTGDLNDLDFGELSEKLKSGEKYEQVFLDLKHCEYAYSKTISHIIGLKKLVASIDSDFILSNVQDGVYQVLELTNLISVFRIERDFSTYSNSELIEFFNDQEIADRVSEHIALHYDDGFESEMLALLDSNDYLLKEYAVLTIGRAHDTDSLDKIRSVMDENVPNTSRACVLVLGWFGDMESKEKIYAYLNSEDEQLAEAAAASIALLSDESDPERLEHLLDTNSVSLRGMTYRALSLINDTYSFELLIKQLERESDEGLRGALIKYISYFNKPIVSDLLLQKLDDTSLKVRESAASSLIRIKATDKIDAILNKVRDQDSWVGYFATKALGELSHSEKTTKALIDLYDLVDDNVKLAIIEAVGKMKNDCSEFLYQLINDPNEDIRKESLTSIYAINHHMASTASIEMLGNDESWLVRFKAIEILGMVKPDGLKDVLNKRLPVEENRYVKDKMTALLDEI